MAKIAVDAVLLPSEEMTERAIAVNKELLKQYTNKGDKIVLDKESCLPHISLAMGCIDERDITDIEGVLQTIAKQSSLGRLGVIGVHGGMNSAGETVSVFEIEKTEGLQLLHEAVMRGLAGYFSYEVTADMLISTTKVSESTLAWIKNYPEKSSFKRFFPHITIGYGGINDLSFPIEFTASKLALCHLGNHCTCRKILTSAGLES